MLVKEYVGYIILNTNATPDICGQCYRLSERTAVLVNDNTRFHYDNYTYSMARKVLHGFCGSFVRTYLRLMESVRRLFNETDPFHELGVLRRCFVINHVCIIKPVEVNCRAIFIKLLTRVIGVSRVMYVAKIFAISAYSANKLIIEILNLYMEVYICHLYKSPRAYA